MHIGFPLLHTALPAIVMRTCIVLFKMCCVQFLAIFNALIQSENYCKVT